LGEWVAENEVAFSTIEARRYFNDYLRDFGESNMFELQEDRKKIISEHGCPSNLADAFLVEGGHYSSFRLILEISLPRLVKVFDLMQYGHVNTSDLLILVRKDPTLLAPSRGELEHCYYYGWLQELAPKSNHIGILKIAVRQTRHDFLSQILHDDHLRPFALQGFNTLRITFPAQPALPIFDTVSVKRMIERKKNTPTSLTPSPGDTVKLLRMLIEELHLNVNSRYWGWTLLTELLHQPTGHNNTLELLQLLHERGADLNLKTGRTPLTGCDHQSPLARCMFILSEKDHRTERRKNLQKCEVSLVKHGARLQNHASSVWKSN